jgi:anti-anti-sigma factor
MVRTAESDDPSVAAELAEVTVWAGRAGVRVVAARGELDALSCPGWRETVLAELARADCRVLVVDLGEVAFAGASVLNVLVETRAAAQRAGSELRLVVSSRAVTRLLELTAMSGRFAVYANRPNAVAAVPGGQPVGW